MLLLTKEQLENVYQMAYRLFTPKDIAIALHLPVEEFEDNVAVQGTPVHDKFYDGRLQQVSEIRESMIKAAKNGSNPAQEKLLELLLSKNDDVILNF